MGFREQQCIVMASQEIGSIRITDNGVEIYHEDGCIEIYTPYGRTVYDKHHNLISTTDKYLKNRDGTYVLEMQK